MSSSNNSNINKSEIFIHNNLYVTTDSFMGYKEESVSVGFVNYGHKEGIDGSRGYYSYPEVVEMIESGKLPEEDFYMTKEGKYNLRSSYCSHCHAFDIYCGKVLNTDRIMSDVSLKAIYDYCRELGLVHDDFVALKGWRGTKTIEECTNDKGVYNITYTLDDFDTTKYNIEFVEKILVGAIKKFASSYETYMLKGGVKELRKVFECDSVSFDKVTKSLSIKGIPLCYMNSNIHSTIRALDLEIWMLTNPDKEWSRFFSAAVDLVRDMGQNHWLSNLPKEESNIHFFDK